MTFETIGKTASFAPLYNGMAQIASQLAKAKAEADKQRKKSEEEAMAKIDDFVISDKNNYTQKFLPYATGSMQKLIERVNEDKQKYPNIWTNRISQHILQAKNELNWALEQSNTQRNIEKSAQEGYVVPDELLRAYKSNYGDVSDIVEMAPVLSNYNINVSENGAVSADLAKPVDLTDEFGKFKNNRALFLTPELKMSQMTSPQGVKFDITSQVSQMDPASVQSFRNEMANNKGLRVTYQTDPNKIAKVNQAAEELLKIPALSNLQPQALKALAVTRAIEADIDALDKTRTTIQSQREAKGMTVNVNNRPAYVQPADVLYQEETTYVDPANVRKIEAGKTYGKYTLDNLKTKFRGGETSYDDGRFVFEKRPNGDIFFYDKNEMVKKNVQGFDAQAVWEKQSDKENWKGVNTTMIQSKKLYDPITKRPYGTSDNNVITQNFPGGVITDYLKIDDKVYAQVAFEIPSEKGFLKSGLNVFLVEVTRGDKFDVAGKNLASTEKKKYNTMYDYFGSAGPSATDADPWANARN